MTSAPFSAPHPLDRDNIANLSSPSNFPIVGVAASAGGLEAFSQLLAHLPVDTGMAFVLIQHLAPDRASLLAEILARVTKMLVCEVQNGMRVLPNQVYVIAPNTKMSVVRGVLQLSPREKIFGKYMPGDTFLTSLAADRGDQAIAVVLSGGDGDGSLGLTAIKAAGGITFAQREDTAKFDSMPSEAVATGNVDFVLSPEQIAAELVKISRHLSLTAPLPVLPPAGSVEQIALTTIFALLRSTTGVDFSHYKPKTINRRIQRRMLVCKSDQLVDYAVYLQEHPAEVRALHEEILIHVTSAKAAIAAITANGDYDLLLSDIGMPEADGFALIRQVRGLAADRGGQIPAAAITAYVSDRDRQRAIEAGFQVHLAKPIDPDQLIQMVATLTGRLEITPDNSSG
jgi:two-component system, chemotaxis family, CheB/CheR fusion protein